MLTNEKRGAGVSPYLGPPDPRMLSECWGIMESEINLSPHLLLSRLNAIKIHLIADNNYCGLVGIFYEVCENARDTRVMSWLAASLMGDTKKSVVCDNYKIPAHFKVLCVDRKLHFEHS